MARRLDRFVERLTRPEWLALLFLLCALPTGLGCALLSPVGAFSDELQHCARADGLRHGEIFSAKPPPALADFWINAGVRIDNGIFALMFSKESKDANTGRPVPAVDRREAAAFPWFAGMTYYPTQMVNYFPVMYVPGALGLLAGQNLGLSPLQSFYLGRVAMLLAFVVLGTAAIGLARFGNGLIFAVLTLPTTVNLASSYNQDGLIIACCALAAALLTRAEPGPNLPWFAALTLLTAVGSAKMPYLALLVGCCLPPVLARGFGRRAGVSFLACILPGLWLLHVIDSGFIAYKIGPYHPGPLWPGQHEITLQTIIPGDNFRVLLAHPLQIVLLPLTSFTQDWHEAWPLFLGGVAWGNIRMGAWEYPCLAVALLAAACSAFERLPGTWRGPDAAFAALALFAAFIGIELSLYLTWTQVGFTHIEGVTPRYFIPLMPFFIFLLPWAGHGLGRLQGLRLLRIPAGWLYLPAMAMALVNVFALPMFLFHLFRMPGP